MVRWLAQADATNFYVAAVTLQELELGVLLAERRDPSRGRHLRAWIDNQVLLEFAERTLAIDRGRPALRAAARTRSAPGTRRVHRGHRAGSRHDRRDV